jgi:hypothetical protein
MITITTTLFWSMSTKTALKSFLTVMPGSTKTYKYSVVCCISLSHNLCCSDTSHSYWSNLVLDLYNFVSFLCILQHTSWNNHPNHSKMSIRHHLWEISAVELVMWFIDWYVFNVTFNNISALSVILTFFPLISGKSQNCHKWLINFITVLYQVHFAMEQPTYYIMTLYYFTVKASNIYHGI